MHNLHSADSLSMLSLPFGSCLSMAWHNPFVRTLCYLGIFGFGLSFFLPLTSISRVDLRGRQAEDQRHLLLTLRSSLDAQACA